MRLFVFAVIMVNLLVSAVAVSSSAKRQDTETVRPFLWHSELPRSPENVVNIFRRFDSEVRDQMIVFYRDVLGIEPLPSSAPGGNAMLRLPIGTSELKLFPGGPGNELKSRPVQDVIGIRLMTLFFPDEARLTARFEQLGYPAPEFQNLSGTNRAALVRDPDGQWVELVVIPGAPPSRFDQIEYGLTVSDIDQSRAFYREFVGLEELPPVYHPILETTKYSYRHGDQIISLWSFGAHLPRDTDTAGLQYVVWDVVGVNALARARNMAIDRPLSEAGRYPRTLWLFDPDDITNYFAQFHENPEDLSQ